MREVSSLRRPGAYFVGSAEASRSSLAIRHLGREEYQRQIAELLRKIKEGQRERR